MLVTCTHCKKNFEKIRRLNSLRHFCSKKCGNNALLLKSNFLLKTCNVCKKTFTTNVSNKRFCNKICFDEHRKNYGTINCKLRKKIRICKYCKKEYLRVYKKSGFCTISCGSKWNIENGNFDKWKNSQKGKRSGIIKNCSFCNEQLYCVSNQFNQKFHYCNRRCFGKHQSIRFLNTGNPMFGRKLSKLSLDKQKRTLMNNHGVTNAYFLSKHRIVSKNQQEIFDYLSCHIPSAKFESEKFFNSKTNRYFIDIFSESLKIVIEYNGDYWHCNPKKYKSTYFHPKKQKYALEIWNDDDKKMKFMKDKGYNVLVIWENDYCLNKQNTLLTTKNFIVTCNKNSSNIGI
jgi:very-short-patch-repair endonuclease